MTERTVIAGSPQLESLLELFSVVLVLDRRLSIVFASDTLQRYMPDLAQAPRLEDAFELVRPRGLAQYEDFLQRLDTLYLLTSRDARFAIRGQMLKIVDINGEHLVFCGSPWLHWINTNCPDIKLGLSDFSHQDVQLDQLLYMATDANMVADLERLNAELQQAKEELESAQASRNAFFAQMSHELRTPLNGIVSALSLMQQEALPGLAGELLGLARKSSSHMLQTINYVLDIAKLEAADTGVGSVEFELSEALESIIDIVRPRALEKGLDLRLHFNAAIAACFRGDVESLRQVLLNLLINAIKFTDAGEVRIDVDRGRTEGMTLRLEVADTGIGIPLEAQATIFEPFETGAKSHSGSAEVGSGLGLDIAKRSVKAMGGEIGMISAAGEGSRFWIELPLEVVEALPSAEPAQPVIDTQYSGRLLLVDDNETNLTLMSMILQNRGVTVTPASSGEQALALVDSAEFDLVLMDISMPGMDGFEAARRIRETRDAVALPVIALSAYTGDKERQESAASGMNGYLVKPLEEHALAKVLGQYLESREPDIAAPGQDPRIDSGCKHVDLATVDNLRAQIGEDNLLTVVEKFRLEVETRWPRLAQAANSADLAREAHTLASTCASFGLPGIAEELRNIEDHAKQGGLVAELTAVAQTESRLRNGVSELCDVASLQR